MIKGELSYFANGALLLSVTIFCLVLTVAWDLYRKRHILRFSRTLNGYKFYPIVGNSFQLLGGDIPNIRKKFEGKFDFPIRFWAGHSFNYVTTDPAEIKVILNHQDTFDKNSAYETLNKVFANTILLAKFDRWKINRKLFAKCFSQPTLQSFTDTFYKRSCILVETLKERQPTDVLKLFERYSMESVCTTIMGLVGEEVSVTKELPEYLSRVQKYLERRLVTSYLYPDFIAHLTPGGRKFLQDVKRIKEMVNEVVNKKRSAHREREATDDDRQSFFDVLFEGTLFNEEDMLREISLFIGAATDTSGANLAFTITLLGMNPHIQEKVYREIEKVVGNKGTISYDDLSNLKYTDRAIRESLRLMPPAPLIGRYATADVDLGARTVPVGSDIIISVFHLHRSEPYWPNPLEYNPDRFLPEEVAKRHPYSYIPFSGGQRNCIGMKYALLMVKMTVANVIRHYHVTSNYKSVEDINLTTAVTLRPTHELDCVFTPRMK